MRALSLGRAIVTLCLLLGSVPAWAQQTGSLQGFSVVLVLGDLQGGTSTDNMPAAARAALGDLKDFLPYKSYRLLDTAWVLGSTTTRLHTTSRLRGPDDQDYEVTLDPVPVQTPSSLQVKFVLREPGGHDYQGSADSARRSEQLIARLTDLQSIRATLEADQKAAASAQAAQRRPSASDVQQQLADINRGITVVESQLRDARTSDGSTLIDTTFTMDVGETVVVGTSRVRGDKALIVLLTAVRRGATK